MILWQPNSISIILVVLYLSTSWISQDIINGQFSHLSTTTQSRRCVKNHHVTVCRQSRICLEHRSRLRRLKILLSLSQNPVNCATIRITSCLLQISIIFMNRIELIWGRDMMRVWLLMDRFAHIRTVYSRRQTYKNSRKGFQMMTKGYLQTVKRVRYAPLRLRISIERSSL